MIETNELFKRSKKNPILTPDDFPENWSVNSVLNPGVGDRDGKTLLFARVEDREGVSRLVCFCSQNGITDWNIDESTVFCGNPNEKGYGVEDPRLTWIDDLQKWAIVYTHYSKGGPLVSIALTKDFRKFEFLGNVLPPNNKDAALFPQIINGYWWLIHRPESGSKQIWIAKSKCTGSFNEDLSHWGGHKILLPTDGTPRWDGNHIGLSVPPLRTNDGWLILYHGVKSTPSANLYRLGLAMLSLNNPEIVTHRTKEFIMAPQEKNDFMGDVGGAIFPCGWRMMAR
jgi:predicted GH43/DUF377 family glycosyl hydrolase